jgi:hypothetical protein
VIGENNTTTSRGRVSGRKKIEQGSVNTIKCEKMEYERGKNEENRSKVLKA